MVFAKNSDRPAAEPQIIEAHATRAPGGTLRTQYVEVPDAGAHATLLSRPTWLWGAEHGVNEHRVAIGNEKVYTVLDAYSVAPALIGMDLVRLGLERARSADEALDTMTSLLATHGQGGVADEHANEPYFSSFLVADPAHAWILETSGKTWAARAVEGAAAISNRLSIHTDWDRASPDVERGVDFDRWRNHDAPTGHADIRLAASQALLARAVAEASPIPRAALLAGHLRNHGTGPWGVPGCAAEGVPVPPPEHVLPDGTGISVCMHVRGYQATTSSIVAELPTDPAMPLRAWVALGSPCVSVFVPVFPPTAVPAELASAELWWGLARIRERVEGDGTLLEALRLVLDPVEAELWAEADAIAGEPAGWSDFARRAGQRLVGAISEVEIRLGF